MATDNHTATTHEEFARLFPDTNRPFAVYYTTHPEAGDCRWCVNDEQGTPLEQVEDMEVAFKLAEEMGKEWREEARLQALAIANLRGSNTIANQESATELSNILDKLKLMMSGADDKNKSQIFNRVISQIAGALPELPQEGFAKKAIPEPTNDRNLRDASDQLREAAGLAEFVQSISLNVSHDGSVILQPGQLFGFYIAMQDTITRIQKAEKLIDEARKEPEVMHA
jgi:hypothetical protein